MESPEPANNSKKADLKKKWEIATNFKPDTKLKKWLFESMNNFLTLIIFFNLKVLPKI